MRDEPFRLSLGRGHAWKRLAGSLLLNQVMMKVIAKRDLEADPQLAIYSHDLIGQAINIFGWWEREELELLRKLALARLGRGGAMLDIGANIGNHSVYLREVFDEIHAVEAIPRTFKMLEWNVEPFPHVHAHQFAASDREQTLEFVVEGRNVGSSHVADARARERAHHVRIEVPARRIDTALAPRLPVRLVKLDVEGHELACLRGMSAILERDHPWVVFEQHAADFVNGSSAVIEELRRVGYRRFHRVTRVPSMQRRSLLGRVLANLQAVVRGFHMEAVETQSFTPDFYEMIIASRE